MRKIYKFWLILIIFLLLVIGIIAILSIFKSEPVKEKNITSIVSKIENYNYTLDDRDTKYMNEEFNNLKTILETEEINYQEYAKSLAKLFIIDFYTLNNKINKYDVGGLEYILNSKINDFKLKAMDTIYGELIDNTYKDRVQELPEITKVDVQDITEEEITLDNKKVSTYKVTMEYTYKEDLDYDKKGEVYLLLDNNSKKLEIVLYNPLKK